MAHNPEVAAKYKEILKKQSFYKNEKDALDEITNLMKEHPSNYQIWAKIGLDEESYYIKDYYVVSDDIHICVAAEYIGMMQIFTAA